MKVYEVFIGDFVRQHEYEVSRAEFNKTFNCLKLKNKHDFLVAFMGVINIVDVSSRNVLVMSLNPFSNEDIKKLAKYIGGHRVE